MRGVTKWTRCSIVACLVAACTYGNNSPVVTGAGPDAGTPEGRFTLGPFAPVPGIELVQPLTAHATVVAANSLYVVGGFAHLSSQSAADTAEIQRSRIGAGDALGSFEIAGQLLAPRRDHAAVVLGDFLYVIGGTSAGRPDLQTSIERATILPDGSLSAFVELPARLVHGRVRHAAIVLGDSLYVVGGVGNDLVPEVERAQILADHTLGPFQVVPGVTQRRYGHTSHVLGSRLYVLGGVDSGVTSTAAVDAASFTGAQLGAFTTLANVALDGPRSGHSSVTAGDSVFVFGGDVEGRGLVGSVEQATLDGDGVLGPLVPIDVPVVARTSQRAIRIGRAIYAIGGDASGGSVLRAPLLDR